MTPQEIVEEQAGCTACDDGLCEHTFVCDTCGRELSVCAYKTKQDECSDCWEVRCLPAGWDKELPLKMRNPMTRGDKQG